MDFKKLTKHILFPMVITYNCGHDNCFRDYTGKIDCATDKKELIVVIKQHDKYYSKWYELDSVRIKSGCNTFNIPWAEQYPQETCHNDCPDGNNTLSDSIRVRVINASDKLVLKDTAFACEVYTFNGDDIELPTITLP